MPTRSRSIAIFPPTATSPSAQRRLWGIASARNFDRPFAATSLAQLWQRWHISLSTWLRDYLYRALRGAKRDTGWRMHRNVFLTMLLGGLWHGAAWTFVIWGAIHGAGLVIERLAKAAITPGAKGASPRKRRPLRPGVRVRR